MSEIAKVLKDLATKIEKALGHDASAAEHRLMHDTGDRLESNVKSHVEHDAAAAATLEKAAKTDAENVRMPHGEGGEPSAPHGGSGPSTSEPPKPHGATSEATTPPSTAGPSTSEPPQPHGSTREPFPGETDLPNPGQPLSSEQYPYLQPKSNDVEAEAIPGDLPPHSAYVSSHPDTHPEIPPREVNNFNGSVDPGYMEPGRTYYRGVGDTTYPNGSYWSPEPPNGEPGFRRDLAVLDEWNGDHGIVSFTPNRRVPMWTGEVGPQWASGPKGSAYLPGGGTQIWIPQGSIGDGDGHWTIGHMPGEVTE